MRIAVAAVATVLPFFIFLIGASSVDAQVPAASPSVSGSAKSPAQNEGNAAQSLGAALSRDLVDLIGYLAWPVTVFVIFFVMKKQTREAIESINKRISDPRTKIGLGTEGLTIETQVNAVDSRVESMQISQDQLKALLLSITPAPAIPKAGDQKPEIPPALTQLARNYLDIRVPDYRERVARKNQCVQEMAAIVIRERVPKDALAHSGNEGLIVAMATAINTLPEQGDMECLLSASEHATLLHVKYRIVLAFLALIQKGLAKPSDYARIEGVLKAFSQGADHSLIMRIEGTRALMSQSSRTYSNA
jgi:hypothetical protein